MNLEEYHITKASGSKYQIELLAVFCGPDLSVTTVSYTHLRYILLCTIISLTMVSVSLNLTM